MITRLRLAALALPLLAAACVDTDGAPLGEMTVDLADTPASPASSFLPFTGELGTTAIVQVSPDGQGWWNLGGRIVPGGGQAASVTGVVAGGPSLALAQERTLRVVLQGPSDEQARVNARDVLPADTYRHVRLWLVGTYAKVTGTIGGTAYAAESLAVVRWPLMVQRPLEPAVHLGAGATATVTFDLNSEAWITPAALLARRVDTVAVKGAVTVTVQ